MNQYALYLFVVIVFYGLPAVQYVYEQLDTFNQVLVLIWVVLSFSYLKSSREIKTTVTSTFVVYIGSGTSLLSTTSSATLRKTLSLCSTRSNGF